MKNFLLLIFQAFLFLHANAQDLVAGIAGNGKPYVTIQVLKGNSLAATLEDMGLNRSLAKESRKVGENYQVPLHQVISSNGADKIWYRTEKVENIQSLATIFEIEATQLMQLNKLVNPSVPKGKYLQLGYLKQAEQKTDEDHQAASVDDTANDPVIVNVPAAAPDSIGGLPVPVGAGYYELEFVGKNKYRKDGRLGLFKTLGGWYDRKYYALSNDLPVGSVVKITNMANDKYVYAKIISKMPGLKEDKQLLIRLNDAGRAALDVWGDGDDIVVRITD